MLIQPESPFTSIARVSSSVAPKKITKSSELCVGREVSLRPYRRNTNRNTSKRARDVRRRFDNGMRETTFRARVDASRRNLEESLRNR